MNYDEWVEKSQRLVEHQHHLARLQLTLIRWGVAFCVVNVVLTALLLLRLWGLELN